MTSIDVPYLDAGFQRLVRINSVNPLLDPSAPGVTVSPVDNVAGLPLATGVLDGVVAAPADVVGTPTDGWSLLAPAVARGAVLRAAEIAGAGQRMLDLSVDDAKERVQFGTPVGKHQAVQYLCTDIAMESHLTALLARRAAWLLDVGQPADRAVAAVTRWYLGRANGASIGEIVEAHRPGFEVIERAAFEVGPESWRINRAEAVSRLRTEGVGESLARRHAALPVVVYGADVIEVAKLFNRDIEPTLDVFLRVGRVLGLDQLTDIARGTVAQNRWQRWALWTVEEEMLAIRRRAAERVLEVAGALDGEEAVKHFLDARSSHVARLVRFMESFEGAADGDVAPIVVALRQVRAALN